jgi:hypothetical protein
LPRRLGDDPLTRAKDERARAAAPAPVATDSGLQVGMPHPGTLSLSRASYNDVFFQRTIAQQQLADARATPEAPEISEISEIPEIREVAAAHSFQANLAPPVAVEAAPASVQSMEVTSAHQVSIIEEVVATPNANVAGTAVGAEASPEASPKPANLPTSSQAPDDSKVEPKPEPQKSGGFFRRLFGKSKSK